MSVHRALRLHSTVAIAQRLSAIAVFLAIATAGHGQLRFPLPIDDNCAVKVTGPTREFDLKHDKDTVGGGSLFCSLGITATQANQAISDFQLAVSAPNRLSAGAIVRLPVEVVVAPAKTPHGKTKTLMIYERAEWVRFVRNKLNGRQREAIAAAKLSDMMIVESQGAGPGFILGNGLVFFSTRNPKHITVWHLNTEDLSE